MSERAQQVFRYFEEQKDYFDARVKNGIELYRKGTARIRVVDADGNPVRGAVVEARQTKQDFKFGAHLFLLDEMETEEKNELYKERFHQVFNLATLPFYWKSIEPEEGKPRYAKGSPKVYRRPATDLCIEYCQKYGIEPKLHCLNYDCWSPDWAKMRSTREYKELLIKRFREIGERYAALIPMIEVTNETFLPQGNATPFFYDDDFCEWSFREAQKYFPANELIINEAFHQWDTPNAHTNRNPYYQQIQKLLDQNVPLHGIGLQCHCHDYPRERELEMVAKPNGRYSPQFMYAVMDKLSELNLPLQITETTIPAFSYEDDDEAIQAELVKKMYSMFFSQKNMEAIVYWDQVDGYAHGTPPGDFSQGWASRHGGLMRFDMTEKPAFKALKKLIREDWMTSTQVTTDEDGYASLRGFHGQYDLTVHANEKTAVQVFHLQKNDLKNQLCISL